MSAPVEIVLIYQSLLGIYGDRGNAMVLVKRLQWRGIDAKLTMVEPGAPVPATGTVYLLGGGEHALQGLLQGRRGFFCLARVRSARAVSWIDVDLELSSLSVGPSDPGSSSLHCSPPSRDESVLAGRTAPPPKARASSSRITRRTASRSAGVIALRSGLTVA